MGIPDTFLLDEVRCGFFVPAAVKQAWAAELEVLMEIDRVCRKHNISYFADWGTLLGAVRHGGFVPWDDDLDIVMKRKDYEKFMTVARFDMEEGFDVQTFRNQKDFWLFMGKVVGKNRFCFEKEHLRRFHNFPYIACVDIFVLDYVYRDSEKEEQRRTLCKYLLGVADGIVEGRLSPAEREKSLTIAEEMYGRKIERRNDPVEMGRYLYGEVEKLFGEVPEQEAEELTQLFPWGLKGNGLSFPKEYYEQPIYLPFEGISMPVPSCYDRMLRMRYGEYMRLVKDAGAHNYPFFEGQKKNLQKVLDFPLPAFRWDPAKVFRSEEEKACSNQSYKLMVREGMQELVRVWERIRSLTGNASCREQSAREQVQELLQVSQQLAVDLGNLLEQVLEENGALIPLLERYCEEIYLFYEHTAQGWNGETASFVQRLYNTMEAIHEELEQKVLKRRAVLFLPIHAKNWSSMRRFWQEITESSDRDCYVAPLPYYYKDYNGAPRTLCCEAAEFPKEARVLDYRLFSSQYLETLHPEMIVIQNPYDAWHPAISVPELFYGENIRKYTDQLVYIPPFAVAEYTRTNAREYGNMQYYVTMPGVVYADQTLVQSHNMRQLYIEKLTEFAGEDTKEIWEERIRVWEPISMKEEQAEEVSKKKILYGISLGTYLEDTRAAGEKIETNFRIFAEHKDEIELTLMLFPEHSLMADMKQKIAKWGEKYQNTARVLSQQEEGNFWEAFQGLAEEHDAYYGDPMPAATAFMQKGKPVMIQNIYL